MNISPELLKKYATGNCTEEERRLVEQWLADDNLSTTSPRAKLEAERTQVWQNIAHKIGWKETKVVPMYRRITRYAAVACIIIGIFMAGRLSVSTGHASPVKQGKRLVTLPNLLHIYGGDGAYGIVAGNRFRLEFEGEVKLYNGDPQPKQIVCGGQEFTLESYQTYFLSGSDQRAYITNDSHFPDTYDLQSELAGGFSILRLE
ncbi:MAG: hypothetical protein ACFB15_30220 [Cyclobacteriaceae bacterium]